MNKMVSFLKSSYKKNKHYTLGCVCLDKLTISQLEDIAAKVSAVKDDKNYIGKLFEKKFHLELDSNNKENFSIEERREQLIQMYEASSERPQSFKSAILLEILENGLKLDIYDKKYFILYLEHPLKKWHMNKLKVTKEYQDYAWNSYIQNLHQREGGVMNSNLEAKMYKRYLEQFYRDKGDLKEFEEYFSPKFLSALVEDFSFLSGKELTNEKVDFEKYDKLASLVVMELLTSNNEFFKPEERVKIHTELKNVPTLHIKIFEINSLNYYKKNWAPFKSDVNLDGFITSYEKEFKFDKISSHKKFRHTFDFPELDSKLGLFVIEFISNGYSSRAIIKKGTLSVIYKQTISGQVAYILDDEREIWSGEDTGIYFKNQFFKADSEKEGKITIPYEKQLTTGNAILVHNGFAQLVEFMRFPEKYTLDVAYIMSSESFIMGNQAKIILRPWLKVNNRKCNLECLSKTKITVITTSFIDHVPVSKIFEDISLKTDKDVELKFSVPANLESVHIELETYIFNISQQTTEKLSSSHDIKLKTNNDQLTFYESHMRKINDQYQFLVLGKNGEPIGNVDVVFSMTHTLYSNPIHQIQLTTDENGIIELGNLNGVNLVTSCIYMSTNPIKGVWSISSRTQHYTFPEQIEILENEDIEFPFAIEMKESKFSQDTFSLIKTSWNGNAIANFFDKAKFEAGMNGNPGIVKISKLEQGYYKISLKESNITKNLIVHQGTYWRDESFILK